MLLQAVASELLNLCCCQWMNHVSKSARNTLVQHIRGLSQQEGAASTSTAAMSTLSSSRTSTLCLMFSILPPMHGREWSEQRSWGYSEHCAAWLGLQSCRAVLCPHTDIGAAPPHPPLAIALLAFWFPHFPAATSASQHCSYCRGSFLLNLFFLLLVYFSHQLDEWVSYAICSIGSPCNTLMWEGSGKLPGRAAWWCRASC